jgi:hypothetical protein
MAIDLLEGPQDLASLQATLNALILQINALTGGTAGPLVLPLGSPSATALQPIGGPTTGAYFPDANSVALVANGVAGLLVDGAGHVTLNATTATPVRINATSAGQQALLSFLDDDTLEWQVGKQTDNSYEILDVVAGITVLKALGGTLTLTVGGGGHLIINGLPTSSAGLTSGMLWLNSNVLTRVP